MGNAELLLLAGSFSSTAEQDGPLLLLNGRSRSTRRLAETGLESTIATRRTVPSPEIDSDTAFRIKPQRPHGPYFSLTRTNR